MGVREVRLCDALLTPELRLKEQETRPDVLDREKGTPCTNVFKGVCALCHEDRCEAHLGKGQLRSAVSMRGIQKNGADYILGAQPLDLPICIFCGDAILKAMNKKEHTIRHVIKTDPEEILSAIRARLTEHALAEKQAPKVGRGFQPGMPSSLLDTDGWLDTDE